MEEGSVQHASSTSSSDEALSDDELNTYWSHACSLSLRYEYNGNIGLVDLALAFRRRLLVACPTGHPLRARSCGDLANSLWTRFRSNGDEGLLRESIRLHRESLGLRPEGHPDRPVSLGNLALALWTQYEHDGGDNQLLEEVIDLQRQSLKLCPTGHEHRSMACGNLAISLRTILEHKNDVDLISEVIKLDREALAVCPVDYPERARFCGNLASSLRRMYQSTRDLQLLSEAIQLSREALASISQDHPGRAVISQGLAICLMWLYEQTGDNEHVLESISLGRTMLVLCPKGHPHHAAFCNSLADSLSTMYQSAGDIDLLLEAVDLRRQALILQPEQHLLKRIESYQALSALLMLCFERNGDEVQLIEAIDIGRQALLSIQHFVEHPNHAVHYASLANLLRTRFKYTWESSVLAEAISLDRHALVLQPEGSPHRMVSCINLASSLTESFRQTGDEKLLIEIISLEREALLLCPKGHADRGTFYASLASSLRIRYDRTQDIKLLVESTELDHKALELRPEGHPDRASSLTNLASALMRQFISDERDEQLLAGAISFSRQALELRPKGHPDRGQSCMNLANTLVKQYAYTEDSSVLLEALDLGYEALSLRPEGHPDFVISCFSLAYTCMMGYKENKHQNSERVLDMVVVLGEKALDTIRGALHSTNINWRVLNILAWVYSQSGSSFYDMSKFINCLARFFEYEVDDISQASTVILTHLSYAWTHPLSVNEHNLIATTYRQLIDLLPLLVKPVLNVQSQMQALKKCSQIGSDAFVSAVLAHDCKGGLEALELSQGVLWSQLVYYRDPQLQAVPITLANDLAKLLQATSKHPAAELAVEERKGLTSYDVLHNQTARIYALLREIRALPGLDRFMLGESYETLCKVASSHPVVVLVGARGRSYALILKSSSSHDQTLLPLDLSPDDCVGIQTAGSSSILYRSATTVEDTELQDKTRTLRRLKPPSRLDRQLRLAWMKIVKPIIDLLRLQPSRGSQRPRLHWCLTGIFSALPVHAAGIYGSSQQVCCADYVVSSYTPTLTALLRAQASTMPLSRQTVSMALIAEKQAKDLQLPVINGVELEIKDVAFIAEMNDIKSVHQFSGSTTVASASAAIKAANVVHLACHGIQDANDATQSGFCFGDGRLTIENLMEMKMDQAFLAFLSACETAKGDSGQPDQVMHLAAAMLFCGFKSVVATMWAMSDIDGPRVTKWFYEALFGEDVLSADQVPYALDSAVSKLRELGTPLERWVPFIHLGA